MIGYRLEFYNPCVDFNRDRYCGTAQHQAMMRNVEARQCSPGKIQTTYNAPRNAGDVYSAPYTFSAIGKMVAPCQWFPMKPCKK